MVSISQLGLPEIDSAVLKVSASSIDTWVASFSNTGGDSSGYQVRGSRL
jgi:transposase